MISERLKLISKITTLTLYMGIFLLLMGLYIEVVNLKGKVQQNFDNIVITDNKVNSLGINDSLINLTFDTIRLDHSNLYKMESDNNILLKTILNRHK